MRSLQGEQSSLIYLHATEGNVVHHSPELSQFTAKRLPFHGALQQHLKTPLGKSNQSHAMMDSTRTQASLIDEKRREEIDVLGKFQNLSLHQEACSTQELSRW